MTTREKAIHYSRPPRMRHGYYGSRVYCGKVAEDAVNAAPFDRPELVTCNGECGRHASIAIDNRRQTEQQAGMVEHWGMPDSQSLRDRLAEEGKPLTLLDLAVSPFTTPLTPGDSIGIPDDLPPTVGLAASRVITRALEQAQATLGARARLAGPDKGY